MPYGTALRYTLPSAYSLRSQNVQLQAFNSWSDMVSGSTGIGIVNTKKVTTTATTTDTGQNFILLRALSYFE